MKGMLIKYIAVLTVAGWAGAVNATLINYDIEYSTSIGTGSFIYDDALLVVTDWQSDFGVFGSFSTPGFNAATTASFFGNPPTDFTAVSFVEGLTGGTAREVVFGSAGTGGFFCLTGSAGVFGECFATGANTVLVGTYRFVEDVPVPATLALFGIGLASLGWSRRKQHS